MQSMSQTIYQTIQLTACKTLCHSINALADKFTSHAGKAVAIISNRSCLTDQEEKTLKIHVLHHPHIQKRYCVMTAHNIKTAFTRQPQHNTGHALPLCVDVKNTFSCHGIPANILTFDCHTP
jgi:hypothetical protein